MIRTHVAAAGVLQCQCGNVRVVTAAVSHKHCGRNGSIHCKSRQCNVTHCYTSMHTTVSCWRSCKERRVEYTSAAQVWCTPSADVEWLLWTATVNVRCSRGAAHGSHCDTTTAVQSAIRYTMKLKCNSNGVHNCCLQTRPRGTQQHNQKMPSYEHEIAEFMWKTSTVLHVRYTFSCF